MTELKEAAQRYIAARGGTIEQRIRRDTLLEAAKHLRENVHLYSTFSPKSVAFYQAAQELERMAGDDK